MRFVKLGLISVVFLFLLMLAFSSLVPSSVSVSRVVNIEASADSVYIMINDLSNWKLWLENHDSSNASVSGNVIGNGAQLKLGNTTVTIFNTSRRNIETVWKVSTSEPLSAHFNIDDQSPPITTLQWQFHQKLKWYPWEKFSAIFSEKALAPSMEKSLDNLKKYLEQDK
jgi:hypothetical protein